MPRTIILCKDLHTQCCACLQGEGSYMLHNGCQAAVAQPRRRHHDHDENTLPHHAPSGRQNTTSCRVISSVSFVWLALLSARARPAECHISTRSPDLIKKQIFLGRPSLALSHPARRVTTKNAKMEQASEFIPSPL